VVLLSINFDIPPEQELMVSICELSSFEGENVTHTAHHTPLFAQRVCLDTRLHGHNISDMATSGTATLGRKATPHTLEPNFLCLDGYLITCVAPQGQVLSQPLPHTNKQNTICFGEKRCHSKHPNKIPLDNDIKERLRKNPLLAAMSIGSVLSA